jgi:hypothetical protein
MRPFIWQLLWEVKKTNYVIARSNESPVQNSASERFYKICIAQYRTKSIFIPFSGSLLEHKPIRVAIGVRGKQVRVMLRPS